MAKPTPKPGAQSRALTQLPLDVGELPIRLTQADFARLIGSSRAWVSMMVAKDIIPTQPGGKIDPSAAFAAMLKRDAETHRLKVLVDIRRRLDDAEERATKAVELLRHLKRRMLPLARLAMESERAFDLLVELLADQGVDEDEVMSAAELALDSASKASSEELLAKVSDDLQDLVTSLAESQF